MENIKKMTVISYGEKQGESYRVTLQPINVAMLTSAELLVERQGRSLYKVFVQFVETGSAELYVNRSDLDILEEAVGFYEVED